MVRTISRRTLLGIGTSLAAHVVVAFVAPTGAEARTANAAPPTLVDLVELTPPPAPPPETAPAPEPPVPTNAAPKPVHAPTPSRAATKAAPAAPPAAAQAGRTLTSESDGVADFTLAQGDATSYVGGTTSSLGTATAPVRGPARGDAKTPAPAAAAPSGPDLSRAASPAGSDWSCSPLFPASASVDHATVLVAVTVAPDGAPRSVAVLRDPGEGFGAAARACALAQRFQPALDRDGHAVSGTTRPFTVRFTR